jgi:toxin-antitoxin system PIN domain toxin
VRYTVDANVLVYASNEADPLHARARELVSELAAGPGIAYLFWPTVMGYLRIVTHPGILPRPLSPADATANVAQLLARPHIRSPGEGDRFWDVFRAIADPNVRGNHVPDAHLAALMRQHGVGLIYTRDRDFRRYAGIEARDPFA